MGNPLGRADDCFGLKRGKKDRSTTVGENQISGSNFYSAYLDRLVPRFLDILPRAVMGTVARA